MNTKNVKNRTIPIALIVAAIAALGVGTVTTHQVNAQWWGWHHHFGDFDDFHHFYHPFWFHPFFHHHFFNDFDDNW